MPTCPAAAVTGARFLLAGLLFAGSAGIAHAAPDRGAALYADNCSACHKAGGIGAPGRHPPLKNRIDKIAATPEGRHYLADLLLVGMFGRIEAGGASYVGYMPAFRQLKDEDIAAILSWLSAQGDSKPAPVITAADIAAARAKPVSMSAVTAERASLAQRHPLP